MRKSFPFCPTRTPRKKTPPGESITITSASIRKTGDKTIIPIRLTIISKRRFISVAFHYIFAPSTGILVACINDDLSLAMNTTAFAISSGVPNRFAA